MKALIIPINQKREILIQDRRGYKKPDWGYFGGAIHTEETPLDAALREAKEEWGLDLRPDDLEYIGIMEISRNMQTIINHMYLYRTNQEDFTVLQGSGAQWMSFE